jgi:hypothetical protein
MVNSVAEDMAEGKDLLLARRQQFLAGKLRRGVEIARGARAIRADQFRGEGVEMDLVAGRDGQRPAVNLDEARTVKPLPDGAHNPVASQQKRPPVGVAVGRKPW